MKTTKLLSLFALTCVWVINAQAQKMPMFSLKQPPAVNSYNIFKAPSDTDFLNGYLYNQSATISSFQSMSIQNFNGQHTDINAEFASFLFGPVRLGLSGTFQSSGDTTKDNAIKSTLQKVISNGGAINLNFLIPIFFSIAANNHVHYGLFGQFYNGITPGIDSTGTTDYSKNLSYTNQTGLIFHFDVSSNGNKAALLSLDVPCFYSISSNNLNREVSLPNFFLARVEIGAVFSNLLSLRIAGPIVCTSSKVQNSPFLVSLQFSPAQILKTSK